jgi:SAM-dependent methyltransferase
LDHEYASGAWDHFFGPDELHRHEVLVELIRAASPHPRLLDLGCGSGRLAGMLNGIPVTSYLGVDVSAEALRRAGGLALPPPFDRFKQQDFEHWQPALGEFDVITFNECLGYAPDPRLTAKRFARLLPAGGALIISHFRATNHAEFWKRLAHDFDFTIQRTATNTKGQVWDLRVLRLRA